VHIVCNNAGVATFGEIRESTHRDWVFTMNVNFWGVVHGCRTFLPHLDGGGHIVNTSSIAGLFPGFAASYDASKHAVVAMSESLYNTIEIAKLPIGVSVLCPGWVRTRIIDAERNWPASLGDRPADDPARAITEPYVRRAIEEGSTPAFVADAVADAVQAGRFWILPHQDFLDICIDRWHLIAERADPQPPEEVPGMPPRSQVIEEVRRALGF
jgi:NAD(P)-dependent dehydrogenase (short-subunit alcohol dehydrogenase family)